MKINNKGLTLVELIVAFAILVMFLFGMLEIVLAVKSKAADEIFAREMLTYKDTLIKTIEDDLIKKKLVSATCTNSTSCSFTFENTTTATLSIDTTNKSIEYGGIKYDVPHADRVYFGTINLDIDTLDSTRNILTIDVVYYEIETVNPNYGFKIVHPYVHN